MLAYAANAPRHGERRSSPSAMLFIVAGHVAALAALMAAKMDLPTAFQPEPTVVRFIPVPKPPETKPTQPQRPRSHIETVQPIIVPDRPPMETIDPTPIGQLPAFGEQTGTGMGQQLALNIPPANPVRIGPRFATPEWALKPPYPNEKLRLEDEASLRLKLTIDANGRVVGVEPVGKVDPVFFEAARRHLLAKWRYKPATEDGRAVVSTTLITLRFQLDDAA